MRGPESTANTNPVVPRRRRVPLVLGTGMLLIGLLGSAVGALWWGDQLRADERRARRQRAATLAATTGNLISREIDVTDAALAMLRVNQDDGTRQFGHWSDLVLKSGRHPGVTMFGYVEVVPAAGVMSALARMVEGMGPSLMAAMSPEQIDELGRRVGDWRPDPSKSHICLFTAGAGNATALAELVVAYDMVTGSEFDIDACQGEIGVEARRARDTGRPVVAPFAFANRMMFVAPHYRGGDVPSTVAARRQQFIGFMGGIADARALLRSAATEGAWLELSRVGTRGRSEVLATSADRVPRGDVEVVNFAADGQWQLKVVDTAGAAGFGATGQSRVIFATGALVSALLVAFVASLGRSRERALRLVDQRTGELRHLALHDPLTELPNRTLIMDRAEHLRQRARRNGAQCAALFLDLDGFKDINDTLGHEAGDTLLKAVAERLDRALRQCDTVGRLGGDEFVVLVEGNPSLAGPEVVAERVLEVMREPFRLFDAEMTFAVTTSVGVAIAGPDDDTTASDLLRDADVALYQAKAGGRDRYIVFRPEMARLLVAEDGSGRAARGLRRRRVVPVGAPSGHGRDVDGGVEHVRRRLAGGAMPRRAPGAVTTIGFLHTADVHVATFTDLLAAAAPTADSRHLVDESLLVDARITGVDDALRARILDRLLALAADVDAVLCTCSTISGAAESLAAAAGVPVVRIDRPMAAAAVRTGRRIGVAAAVESTLAPTLALLREEAEAAGVDVDIVALPCLGAWAHFEAGDMDAFLSTVADHVDAVAPGVDVVVLAQASMAAAATRCATDRPVLTSPRSGIDAVLGDS